MKVLGIETSCDETSAAVVEDGRRILSSVVVSQIDLHSVYGGVVPEIASRNHLIKINSVLDAALKDAGIEGIEDMDRIAVTVGPGLVGALLIGLATAKTIAMTRNIPLVPINHMEAHVYSAFMAKGTDIPFDELFPAMALLVSGGHTNLVLVRSFSDYEIIGSTRDDAAGEAFDKVAQVMGLPYPGGPSISNLARQGDPLSIPFTKPLSGKGQLDFSFSGLKTAVMNHLRKNPDTNKADVAASFERTVVDTLIGKARSACETNSPRAAILCGGVSANATLRDSFGRMADCLGLPCLVPEFALCTDNAAMVAGLGFHSEPVEFFDALNASATLEVGKKCW